MLYPPYASSPNPERLPKVTPPKTMIKMENSKKGNLRKEKILSMMCPNVL
jgi:hypothetical protein